MIWSTYKFWPPYSSGGQSSSKLLENEVWFFSNISKELPSHCVWDLHDWCCYLILSRKSKLGARAGGNVRDTCGAAGGTRQRTVRSRRTSGLIMGELWAALLIMEMWAGRETANNWGTGDSGSGLHSQQSTSPSLQWPQRRGRDPAPTQLSPRPDVSGGVYCPRGSEGNPLT